MPKHAYIYLNNSFGIFAKFLNFNFIKIKINKKYIKQKIIKKNKIKIGFYINKKYCFFCTLVRNSI